MTYYALINADPENGYLIHFPDLQGCYSEADTLPDAHRTAIEILHLYIDREDPKTLTEPSSITTLLDDKDVQTAILSGGILLPITHKANATQ